MKNSWIILGIIALLAVWGISNFNTFVKMNEEVDQQWSSIEIQLQRRAELIPNLVQTVKGFAAHEKEILSNIAEARAKLSGAQGVAEKAMADAELTSALSRLLMIVENYPQLKADQNFRQLMDELAGTENRVAVARRDYNLAVKEYNTRVKQFPWGMFARMVGFGEREYFEADKDSQKAPEVKF